MEIEYRKLTEAEVDAFTQAHIAQLLEEGAAETADLRPAIRDYCLRHLADGTFVAWLAYDGDTMVGTSGMSLVEKPPYYGCPNGRIGMLSCMYTAPAYRRKGVARTLLQHAVDEARAFGCGVVQVTASNMGVLLYSYFGFQESGNFMQYPL